jgi:hypothetical protein
MNNRSVEAAVLRRQSDIYVWPVAHSTLYDAQAQSAALCFIQYVAINSASADEMGIKCIKSEKAQSEALKC